jgi:hypothetical protein
MAKPKVRPDRSRDPLPLFIRDMWIEGQSKLGCHFPNRVAQKEVERWRFNQKFKNLFHRIFDRYPGLCGPFMNVFSFYHYSLTKVI